MNRPTADNFYGLTEVDRALCVGEGMNELGPGDGTLSAEDHVGFNKYYADYSWSYEISQRAQDVIGFKLATISELHAPSVMFVLLHGKLRLNLK